MKIKVGVFFGGKSVEHEISIISAVQAMLNFDKEKYEVVPVYITKNNKFYTGELLMDIENYKDIDTLKLAKYEELAELEGIGTKMAASIVEYFANQDNIYNI